MSSKGFLVVAGLVFLVAVVAGIAWNRGKPAPAEGVAAKPAAASAPAPVSDAPRFERKDQVIKQQIEKDAESHLKASQPD